MNGEPFEYDGLEELPEDKADPSEIVRCAVCGKPAVRVDRRFPREAHLNRCGRHFDILLDERAYYKRGEAVEVCEEHHKVCLLMTALEDTARDLEKEDGLRESLRKALDGLEEYCRRKWPGEQPEV